MLKAIVFDFDGVIVDSEPLHFQAFLAVGRTIGCQFDYAQYLQEFVGFDDRDAFGAMLEMVSSAPNAPEAQPPLADLYRAKQEAFANLVGSGGVSPLPGALELIAQARGQLPIAIASGATRLDIELILEHLDRRDCFQTIVSADDVQRSKPDPASYQLAVERLAAANPEAALQPRDCLAIEDTAAGIASASTAGLMTLGLATTGSAQSLREAQRVVASLGEVSLDQLLTWYA